MMELTSFKSANMLISFVYAAIGPLDVNINLQFVLFFHRFPSVHSGPKVERDSGGIVGGLRPNQEWERSLFLTHTSTLQVQ